MHFLKDALKTDDWFSKIFPPNYCAEKSGLQQSTMTSKNNFILPILYLLRAHKLTYRPLLQLFSLINNKFNQIKHVPLMPSYYINQDIYYAMECIFFKYHSIQIQTILT